MKKITLLILIVIPFLGFSQLITNNTFDTEITPWGIGSAGGGTVIHDGTTGNVAIGSAKLDTDVDGGSRLQLNGISVNTTGDYVVSFYVKGTAGTEFRAQIWQSGASGTTSAYQTITTTGVWQAYSHTVTLTAGNGNASIRLWGKDGNSTFHFDDVYLLFDSSGFDYDFTFDSDDNFEGWVASGGSATVATGALNLTPSSNNPKIELDSVFYQIPADTYTKVAITLTNGTSNELLRVYHPKAASGTLYTEIYIAPNASEQTYTLNLTGNDGWSGTIEELGILIRSENNGSAVQDGTVNFSRIQFSSTTTEKHVYNFDGVTTEGWEMVTANGYVSDVSSGLLTFIPKAGKFAKLTMGANHVNTVTANAIRVVLENNSTTDNQIKITLPSSGGNIVESVALAPAAEDTYEIVLDGLSGWTGNVSQISLNFLDSTNGGKSSGGGEFIVNKIEFFATETIGVNEVKADSELSIYPNPVNDKLTISKEVEAVEIYNILGQKIVSLSTVKSVDTSNLESGSYIAKIKTKDGLVATKRFMKN